MFRVFISTLILVEMTIKISFDWYTKIYQKKSIPIIGPNNLLRGLHCSHGRENSLLSEIINFDPCPRTLDPTDPGALIGIQFNCPYWNCAISKFCDKKKHFGRIFSYLIAQIYAILH